MDGHVDQQKPQHCFVCDVELIPSRADSVFVFLQGNLKSEVPACQHCATKARHEGCFHVVQGDNAYVIGPTMDVKT